MNNATTPGTTRPGVVALVALGGALGGAGRYAVSLLLPVPGNGFPVGTLAANLTGSLLLGIILFWMMHHLPAIHLARAFFAIGFLGSFTTFSSLAIETLQLAQDGRRTMAALYALISLMGGLTAAFSGILLGRRFL